MGKGDRTMAKTKDTKVLHLIGIPPDLHEDFKILCIRRRISMSQRLIELMARDVQADALARAQEGR
jgi:hypothetical protein